MRMAHKSSMMANAVKNIFNEKGTALPTIAKTPSEKAISVAVGMAHPCSNPVPRVTYRKINAGNATPNRADMAGNIAFLNEDSSPTTASLFISIPT